MPDYIKALKDAIATPQIDQDLMYQSAHKLVGASSYAGARRVHMIADKMQKWVPKQGGNPNYDRYKQLHAWLLKEIQLAAQEFEKYKSGANANNGN